MNAFFYRLRFFVADAWDELRHSPGVNLLAAGTLVSVLFGAGLVAMVVSNVENFVTALRDDVRIEVYLDEGLAAEQRDAIEADLRAFDGVQRVEFINKDEALERYRLWAGEMAALAGELEINPLPESFEIVLSAGPDGEAQASEIFVQFSTRDGVEQVRFDRDLLSRLDALLRMARIGGGGLGLLAFAAVVFIMASVLRLAVYARRDEIEIMLLVGATPAFVRGPFLVAGVVQGLVSSLAAWCLVELARRSATGYAGEDSLAVLDLILANPLPTRIGLALILLGLVVSCTAAWFAVRQSRHLRGVAG